VLREAVAQRAAEFDVIHAHIDWLHVPVLTRLGVPFLTTLHGRLDLPGVPEVIRQFPSACFVSISDRQRTPLKTANWCGTVHHGPPASLFRPSYEQGSYLAFLGRLRRQGAGGRNPDRPRRGHAAPHSGEGAAKRDGVLREASRVGDRRHAGPGEVDERRKQPFLSGAAALLFPIDWPEPFSLVIIEAMACGTPVIAYRAGSVPEVVDEGVTGLIVDNEAKAVRAVKELARIDRHKVRARFKERFTSDRMARPTRPTIGGFSSPSLPTYRSPTITSARLRLRSSRERRCSGG
jgi:glycosyltransferase involved in cell wall biosynthesis